MVNEIKTLLFRGKEISEQINILGDDGVPTENHVVFWKSELIDFVILQQDAFDKVDSVCSLERQKYLLESVIAVCRADFNMNNFNEVMDYFKKMINLYKQQNYCAFKTDEFYKYENEIKELISERIIVK